MKQLVGFVGSSQKPSKTFALVSQIRDAVSGQTDCSSQIYDLLDIGPSGFPLTREALPSAAERILRTIETADALIIGSPTYKGSYAGLFKHIFDLLDPAALAGKPVAIVATGGGHRHALVVEHQIRPLLGFFAAMTMPTAVYAAADDFSDGTISNHDVGLRIAQLARELASALSNTAHIRDPLKLSA